MRKSATYFEQIPVQRVKEIVATLEGQAVESLLHGRFSPTLQCSICRKPVPVETAKTDGDGKAVHEECYIVRLTQKPAVARTRRAQPSS
jgi:hypothetical protein